MAANSIGNAALRLTANGGELVSGLASAASGIKAWGDKTQATVAGAVTAVAGKVVGGLSNAKALLSGAGTAIGTMLGGPIGGAIGSAVGAAAGGIVETIFTAVTEPFEKLNLFGGIVKQAATLGIGASQLQGLQLQLAKVGIEGDQVSQTFASMGKNVADAAGGHGRAAPAFKQLGIDAGALLQLPVDEQFKAIADSISQLPAGAAQASMALHIFGGEGAKLLPILQKGGQGIQDFIEQQKKTGAVLGDSQLKAAAEAAKAWKESKAQISSVWDGLVNRATLIAAPIIKFVGGTVSKVFALLTPVFEWLGVVIGKVAEVLTAVFEVFAGWITEAVDEIKSFANEWFTFSDKTMSVEKVVVEVLRAIAIAVGYVWDTFKLGIGVIAVVTGAILEYGVNVLGVFRRITDLAKELPDDLRPAWVDKFVAGVDRADDSVKAFGAKIKNWGKDAVGSWGDSAGKIGTFFDKLGNRRKEEEKAAKALDKKVADIGPYKGIAAALEGSKEAYSIESKFRWDAKNEKVDQQKKAADELVKVNQGINKLNQLLGTSIPLVAG